MRFLPTGRWKQVLLVVLVLLAACVGLFAYAFSGLAPLEQGRRVGPAYTVKLGFVSAYVLDAGNGTAALVDTGADATGRDLLEALRTRGFSREAVQAIFLTHGHGDHTAAVPLFPRAAVYALADEQPIIEGRVAGHSPIARFRSPKLTGIRVTHPLRDGATVTVGTLTVRAFALPGHTVGSAAYLVGETLFLGDAANASPDGQVFGPPWLFSEDKSQGIASLRGLSQRLQQAQLSVRALVFAHSGPLTGSTALTALAAAH